MSALGQPRMVWLECGHERISMRPVYPGRKVPCFVCHTKERITHWGFMNATGKPPVKLAVPEPKTPWWKRWSTTKT